MSTLGLERWLPVVGWDGFYEVSSHGRVRSLDRVVDTRPGVPTRMRGRVLKPYLGVKGHPRVGLTRDGAQQGVWIHRLVAAAFIGPLPEGQEVRHLDGNPTNNRVENLAYGTHSQNMLDAVRHGTHNEARKTHCVNGHEFTPENTRRDRKGARECIECRRTRNLRVTARRRAARERTAA